MSGQRSGGHINLCPGSAPINEGPRAFGTGHRKQLLQAIIARELALLLVDAAFPPEVVHTPGVAHKVDDHLSRVYSSSSEGNETISHPALLNSIRTVVPARPRAWYLTLDSPC